MSAALVLLVIIYGYVMDCLPETAMTQLDEYLLARIQKGPGPIFVRAMEIMQSSSAPLLNVAHRIFGASRRSRQSMLSSDDPSTRKRRRDNLGRFVMALSDQQLVTGLAVLVTGYIQVRSISLYHFDIIASLAWFSSTTHLATLGLLKTYLFEHPPARQWRVAAMLSLFSMLFFAQIPAWAVVDNSVPVCCFYSVPRVERDFADIITLMTTLGFLVIMYAEGITRLYSLDMDWNIPDRITEALTRLISGKSYHEPSYRSIAQDAKLSRIPEDRVNTETRVARERTRFERLEFSLRNSHWRFKSYVLATIFMARELGFSFLGQMFVLLIDLIYGFISISMYRSHTPTGGIVGNQNEMSFGQMVPLFLLILPVCSALEMYFGKHHCCCLYECFAYLSSRAP